MCLLLLCAGCHPHVELKAPEPTAPLEEREAAYEALRIESLELRPMPGKIYGKPALQRASWARTLEESTGAPHAVAPEELPEHRKVRFAHLGDGTHIHHAADLTPVVEPGSAASEALKRSASRRLEATILNYVGGALMLGGASYIAVSAVKTGPGRDDNAIIMGLGVLIGGGIILVGGVVHAVAGGVRGSAKATDRVAFEHYNSGLALRLHVCADERVLVPCADRFDSPGDEKPLDK